MAEKFNTRIIHKHDIESNWNKAVNFIPKNGEIIIYDADENYSYPRIKVGDGVKDINSLSFITDALETVVANKLDKNNPVYEGTLSNATSNAMGYYAVAEGSRTTASGDYSHAEGYSSYEALDYITKDSTEKEIIREWDGSPFTLAFGSSSHAEGYNTLTIGNNSHAEGEYTHTIGVSSHAEGYITEATGDYSHAEGYLTTASGECSHVQGKYNIPDHEYKYAHVVGNGSLIASNAHTLDWEGNAWFAGDVYVGSAVKPHMGTNRDEGSKKLATEEYVMNEITKNHIQIITWEDND